MRGSRHFKFPSTPHSLRLGYGCAVALRSARFASSGPRQGTALHVEWERRKKRCGRIGLFGSLGAKTRSGRYLKRSECGVEAV
jgi:hypothetical protein